MPTLVATPKPRTAALPTEYSSQLAIALLDAGIADPSLHWNSTPASFIANAVNAFVERHGGREVRRRFYLDVSIGSDADDGMSSADEGEAILCVQSRSAAFITLGKATEWLDTIHPQLPASVAAAVHSLGSINRIYCWHAAEEHREYWLESMADEYWVDEGAGAVKVKARLARDEAFKRFDVEHPPIVLPEPLKRPPLKRPGLERLLRKRDVRVRNVVDLCLQIDEIKQTIAKDRMYFKVQEPWTADCSLELPVLVLAIEERDGICASFDEEAQHMRETGEEAPNACWPVGFEPAAVRQAFGCLELTVRLYAAVSMLADALPGNHKWVNARPSHRPRISNYGHHNSVRMPIGLYVVDEGDGTLFRSAARRVSDANELWDLDEVDDDDDEDNL